MSSAPLFQFDNSYAQLPDGLFRLTPPSAVRAPSLALTNPALAQQLGVDINNDTLAEQLSGNQLPDGAQPLAQAYAGHQFGHINMLGDGRAVLLGEHIDPQGQRWDVQLKGSGITPFSRGGDGRAGLAPMLREYVISEAMHALGIPSSRSLAVTLTGESVYRENTQPGAVLTRIASSHLRIGTFQFAAGTEDATLLPALFEYTLTRHYHHCLDAENPALAFFDAVMKKQIALIVHWMRVGFIHGVMNTDNVMIAGETLDYGPCAFMDHYDPNTVFSSIDRQGRYAYDNQAPITQWNLARLVETLIPLIDDDTEHAIALATEKLKNFPARYDAAWLAMMRNKLGLHGTQENDLELVNTLLTWMHNERRDFTNTFRDLTDHSLDDDAYAHSDFQQWFARWQQRCGEHGPNIEVMRSHNPALIPRNHQVNRALDLAEQESDFSLLHTLLDALAAPYQSVATDHPLRQPPKDNEKVCATFCGT